VTSVGCTDGVVAGWKIRDVPVPDGWVASLALAPEKTHS
jgi:4'-phosphopantetheinyl transferase